MQFPDWMIPATVALLASLAAGVTDVTRFKVYNKLTFPLAAAGLCYHASIHGGSGLTSSLLAMVVGLAVLWIPYALGGLGAGDVKFFAAVCAWLGLSPMFTILAGACLATGIYSVIVLSRRDGFRGVLRNLYTTLTSLLTLGWGAGATDPQPSVQEVLATAPNTRQRLVPFSAMIGVGVLAAVTRHALTVL